MPDVDDADQLYALAPEEFTAARDALASRLRAAKDREQAGTVKKLRRPSVIAWALNQAARADGGLIESSLAAGAELREAMSQADGGRIREAERASRRASDAVVDAAARVLHDSGGAVTDDARSRMAATVRAAIVDPEVAARLRAGTLERDVELAGLGVDDILVETATRAPAAPRGRESPAAPDQRQAERDERRHQEEARRAARARLGELEDDADRLARRAERLTASADRAEQSAREARAEAEAAQAAARAAAQMVEAGRTELGQD